MSQGELSRRVAIGTVAVDPLSFEGAIEQIEHLVESGRGGAVFTPNVDHVVLAERDLRFRRAYARATLCLPDGMPLVWASRLLGEDLPEKVSGADLVLPLMRRAVAGRWRVFLLGGGPGVARRAAAILRRDLPGLAVVGTAAPRIDMDEPAARRTAVIEAMRRSRANLVLVALGAPKQELFVEEALPRLPSAVFLGVGASLDFVAGTVRRCPQWLSERGFEWLYRLLHEPRRLWRRYLLRDPHFLTIVLRQRWQAMTSSLEPRQGGKARP